MQQISQGVSRLYVLATAAYWGHEVACRELVHPALRPAKAWLGVPGTIARKGGARKSMTPVPTRAPTITLLSESVAGSVASRAGALNFWRMPTDDLATLGENR
jgi:hypothetical protein